MSLMKAKQMGGLIRIALVLALLSGTKSWVMAEQLPIKVYTTADGLARDAINCIVRDSRGFLWFGTFEGLSRFDGYRFTNYTTADGLPERRVRDLLETRNGAYWIATGDGVVQFNPYGSSPATPRRRTDGTTSAPLFTVYHPAEEMLSRSVFDLFEDHTGAIWCGTAGGLYQLEQTGDKVTFRFVDMGMPRETSDDSLVEKIL